MEPEATADEFKTAPTITAHPPPSFPPPSAHQNQKASSNSLKIREEGELSSSETDDFPGGSTSQFSDNVPARTEPVQVAATNKSNQLVLIGKSALIGNATSSVGVNLRTCVPPTHRKGPEKNRVPFVISFSDDDSGSEPEEYQQGQSVEFRGHTREVDGSRRLPTLLEKSQMSRGSAGNVSSKMPRKRPLSRTFVSSMTRINGSSSRNGAALSVGQTYRLKNGSTLNQAKAGQNVHLNSSKLQDLRQLIAIRENELKLRAAKHKNEIASALCKDQTALNLKNDAMRNKDSVDFLHFETEVPKKRLKLSEPRSITLNSDDQPDRPATVLMSAPEKSASQNFDQQGGDDRRSSDKDILSSTTQPSATHMEKQGTDVINSRECNKITVLAESSAMVANRASNTSPNKSLTAGVKHPGEPSSQHEPGSNLNSTVPREPINGCDLTGNSLLKEGMPSNKVGKHTSKDTGLARHVSNSILEKPDACLKYPSSWNSLGNMNVSETGNMDIESLLEIEDLQDKELEDAQELRHQCEVEERNALKAYRKAQRALAEANARCSYLYRKRELFSAHFRSRLMEDSSLSWLTRPQNHIGASVNSLTNMSEDNMPLVPMSSHRTQAEFDRQNQHLYNLNGTDGALENLTDRNEDGRNVASEPCSEPDASSSEQEDNGTTNALGSLSTDMNISADEDEETFPLDLIAGQTSRDCQMQEGCHNEQAKDVNEACEDTLLLEATLRSQLFARLGIQNSLKRGSSQSVESTVECPKGEVMGSTRNIALSGEQKDTPLDSGGINRSEKSASEHSVEIKRQSHNEKFCSNYESSSIVVPQESCSVKSATVLCPLVRSAFSNLKDVSAINSIMSQATNQQIHATEIDDVKGNGVDASGPTITISNSMKQTSMNVCVNEGGSYTNSLAIDPSWPLCMFELRGKCNDDECAWQHVRDYSSRDCLAESSSLSGKYHGAINPSKCLSSIPLAPPIYLVSLDTLKADLRPYKYAVSQNVGQRWQKCFSAYLVLSNVLPSDLRSDESCLHGPEARIEVQVGWNRQSSFFHSRNGTVSQSDEQMADNDQVLEMALLNFNREVSKQNGRIEALKVLARAIETNPSSIVIWVVYLHVYYSNQNSIGKDDLFQVAVEQNGISYELWLMYINSREKLNDRVVAFDTALSALCRQASASDSHAMAASQHILDLFLQMMNFLCISGEIGQAILKIYGLLRSSKKSSDPHKLFLPDISMCLTIYDKSIFWVCCVYFVVYKKLPNAIVQCFECQKELSAIDWPSICLTAYEKQQSIMLMESAVDSLALYIDSESLESETTLKAAHFFALNHIKFIAVLEGLECSKNLLEKYIKLYPSCLELVLMSARSKEYELGNVNFVGFEEALSNWMEGVPGVQCIWNQYVESALRHGMFEFAKELLDRWFHSVWEVQFSQNEISDPDTDDIFGLLNLSLYKLLQNEHTEASLTIERALKVASAEDYKHSVREHAMFLLKDGSNFKEAKLLKMLNDYLTDSRASSASEPFSRKFIAGIKKPRVQQLVNNLFASVSCNTSLVNMVLELCFGPSLLPQVSGKLTDLVDFVEAIMEIAPTNYQLAVSLCKFLSGIRDSVAASASVSFWASSILTDSLLQAVPVAPEYVWVEAAQILQTLSDIQPIAENFHKRALLVYPFSINLWKSYLSLSRNTGKADDTVIGAARERGIKLD